MCVCTCQTVTAERTVTHPVGRDILVTRASERDSEEDKGRKDEEIV